MILKFRNHYPDHKIKSLRVDNAKEFASKTFEDFCSASAITLTYSVPYKHSQNGLAEAFIKKVQLVTRPLLIHARLPSHYWGHAVLHAAALLRFRPTPHNTQSPLELVSGKVPNVAHLRTFGCKTWVPAPEPSRKTIVVHCLSGIYVGFDSPFVIRYLSLPTTTLLRARFQNCQFEEDTFPSLSSLHKPQKLDFFTPETFIRNSDPRTALTEQKIAKLVSMKALADRLPDGFSNAPRIAKNPPPGAGFAPLKSVKRKASEAFEVFASERN